MDETTTTPTNGGRITDELRHYIEGVEQLYGRECPRLRAIADRIDEEHEREVADTRNDALYHANDKDMADLGWVRLPKDADGTTVRETCEMQILSIDGLYLCKSCGYVNAGFALQPGLGTTPNFCPHCGKRVVIGS